MVDTSLGVPADIQYFLRSYVAAYASGSLDELRPFYANDALICANQRDTVIGWESVRAMFSPSFARYAIDARANLKVMARRRAERQAEGQVAHRNPPDRRK